MSEFENWGSRDGFSMKLWRGERMCLLGFDVAEPEPDFVGFAIEVKRPGANNFTTLRNRIAFSYPADAEDIVSGYRIFPSTEAPFQKFRWMHFPYEPQPGAYTYRATKMHMPQDGQLVRGVSLELQIPLDPITHEGFLDVGFTRNFASSQAFADKLKQNPDLFRIIPSVADDGLTFQKQPDDIYDWLGFEAYDLIFQFLKEAVEDPSIELDVLAYDLNEPDIVAQFERLGTRLRIVIDDSAKKKDGILEGHGGAHSAESQAADRLRASAGPGRVKRTHFSGLQHHKVFIARRNGAPFKVLGGSTNFSFRGLYIQANNALVFHDPEVARLFGEAFELAFQNPSAFKSSLLAGKWHLVAKEGRPRVHLCFSPHKSADLPLNPVRGAIDQASSSVFFSVAFLNQIQAGPTKEAFDRLMQRPIFSYGVVDKRGGLEIRKPNGSIGLVDFAYLSGNAPQPFRDEWSGGRGINVHHKFVVTDFNLPTAKVFTGSSNLAPNGEEGNGDHLILIEDRKIATAYALEALRIFDHLHFRSRMEEALGGKKDKKGRDTLTLQKPVAINGNKEAWFERYYAAASQLERDRKLFSQ